MYYEELPAYAYELPCGHAFRSLTLSTPDDDGLNWFFCQPCRSYWGIIEEDIVMTPPRCGQRAMGDHQLSVKIDSALKLDRVVTFYLAHWDGLSIRDVAASTGVSQRLVERAAGRLGVYERGIEV